LEIAEAVALHSVIEFGNNYKTAPISYNPFLTPDSFSYLKLDTAFSISPITDSASETH
jgi:hypothetical protein